MYSLVYKGYNESRLQRTNIGGPVGFLITELDCIPLWAIDKRRHAIVGPF